MKSYTERTEYAESLGDQFKAAMQVEGGFGLLIARTTPGDGLPKGYVLIDAGEGRKVLLSPEEARKLACEIYALAKQAEEQL